MRAISRNLSRLMLPGLLLGAGLSFGAVSPAFAQLCTIDNLAIPAIDENTDADIEDVDYTISEGDTEIMSALGVMNANLTVLFGNLAGTNTNNSTMNTALSAKGQDYQASTQYTQAMQLKQADEQKQYSAGNLAYQNNNLCQNTTLAGGVSSLSNSITSEYCSYNPILCQVQPPVVNLSNATQNQVAQSGGSQGGTSGCTTCGDDANGVPAPPTNTSAFTSESGVARVHDMALAASGFSGSTDCPEGSNSSANSDNSTTYTDVAGNSTSDGVPPLHLDVSALDMYNTLTYGPTVLKAHDAMTTYFAGTPPEIPAHTKSFCENTQVANSALVTHREKLAFRNLSAEAFAFERANHDPVDSGSATAVTQIFKNANFSPPTVAKNGNGQISMAAWEDAAYRQEAEMPQMHANLAGMQPGALLALADSELLLLNRMEYERYLVEKEMFKVQSASLNLQARSFNFSESP